MIYLVVPIAIVAIAIFIYMRNRQAKRNDNMRSRFWKMEEELIDMLQGKNNDQKESNDN